MSLYKFVQSSLIYFRKEFVSISVINRTFSQPSGVVENEKESNLLDPENPRRLEWEPIDPKTSIQYMKSEAYKEAYGEEPVWKHYRRNFIGHLPPKTRETCIRKNKIATASPCPICRDKYLVVDYKNIDLLKQFISPSGGAILDSKKTGLCQKQHSKLLIAIQKAKNYGLLAFDLPFRKYSYKFYKQKYFSLDFEKDKN